MSLQTTGYKKLFPHEEEVKVVLEEFAFELQNNPEFTSRKALMQIQSIYKSMFDKQLEIIRDLYNSSAEYEKKYQGLYQWQLPSLYEAKKMLVDKGYPEHALNKPN